MPALASIGVIKPGLRLSIAKEVDIDKLWKMVYEGSQHYEFDVEWIRTTFGIEVVCAKQQQSTLPSPTKPKKGKTKDKKDDEPQQGEEQRDSLLDFFV